MKVIAVVASAGAGRRLKIKTAKPLVVLEGKPILIQTLKNLSQSGLIDEIVAVVDKKYLGVFQKKIKQFGLKKVRKIVAGGSTRANSVYNGLKAITGFYDFVLIHDAARPFIARKPIRQLLSAAKRFGAAILAVPIKATVKEINPRSLLVIKTLNRDVLWEVQTPQVFQRDLILAAFQRSKGRGFTDDAALVEKMGRKVKVVMGSYANIKITTPEDLALARVMVKSFKG